MRQHRRVIKLFLISGPLALAFLSCALAWTQGARTGSDRLPLEPARTVEFTTDEGTWMSLDVSPDGKSIVFDLIGHLYTLPIGGGEAKAITGGMEFDRAPRFSPDGRQIVFVSDRGGADDIWIANPDGSDPRQLTREEHTLFVSPRWTPDGNYILVSRKKPYFYDSAFELWLYDIHGGSGIQVTSARKDKETPETMWHNALGGAASPDGRYFYYARKFGYFSDDPKFPLWQIARRDRRSGDEDVITQDPGSAFRPELSPDGTFMVYGTRYDAQTALRVRNMITGDDHWLIATVQRDDQESYFATRDLLPGYAFLPGGKEMVISYGGKFHRVDLSTGKSALIPFNARVKRELGPRLYFPARVDEGPVKARVIQGAVQSPDGKRLAFSAFTHLYVTDLPNGTPHRITKSNSCEYQPAWSPDGQWIAYVTWENAAGQIWKIRADGQGEPQQLTRVPSYYRDPVWSPDASKIVALREGVTPHEEGSTVGVGTHAPLDLIWLRSSGGDATIIVPGRGEGRPHFLRDAEHILITDKNELITMRLDGTDRRTLLKLKGKDVWGRDFSPGLAILLSPDAQHGLALFRSQLYLFDMPTVGGEAPTLDISEPALPVRRLTDAGADFFDWADDGKTITWTLGSTFFRLPLNDAGFLPPEPPKEAGNADQDMNTQSPTQPLHPVQMPVSVEESRATSGGTVVLRGARAITMRGDEVLPDADIVVTDNRIAAVGKTGSITIPSGAYIINLKGMTIVPGFVDTHAHWIDIHRGVLDLQNWDFLANLAYGVTTGRDPQTFTNDIFAYQDMVDTGQIIGPRAYSTGPGIFWVNDFQSTGEAATVVSRYKDYYRTATVKSYLVGNRKQREFMVQACEKLHIMPTTEGASDMALDLTHVIDGFSGNEHQFPIVPLYKDVVQLVAQSGIFYTPTFLIGGYGGPGSENYFYETTDVHDNAKLRRFVPHNIIDQKTERRDWFRKDQYVFDQGSAAATAIIRAGGRVCVGGHGQLQGLGYHWEMWSLSAGGMSNLEVLRSATLFGAEALGLSQDLGSIEPGKLADLVVLERDPLQNIHNTDSIRYVIKNGEIFDGETLAEVWPTKKPAVALWWSKDNPDRPSEAANSAK